MMHEEELKDKCALSGRSLSKGSDDSTAGNLIIEEIIQNTGYKFDTRECATMFERFLDVYGNQFQPFWEINSMFQILSGIGFFLKKMKSRKSESKTKQIRKCQWRRR
jgi:hypothetical protein